MAEAKESLKDRISHLSEITISVTGRKSGQTISNPVWFVLEGETLYLLPVKGTDTQWYKNVLKNPLMHIRAGGAESEVKISPVADAKKVAAVVEKFRHKDGAGKARYSRLGPIDCGIFSARW